MIHLLVPVYLLICSCLGGASAGGFAANCFLQLLALPLIGWGLLTRRDDTLPPAGRSLLCLGLLLAVVMFLQLVPLPPAVWTVLPGRRSIYDGYRLLGAPLPWLPLSLAPQAATASALWLLPAFATLLGMIRLGAFRPVLIGAAIVAAAVIGVVVGAIQVLGGPNSPWYFYKVTNAGQAVGFFANSNHMATLLVVAIPFGAAIQANWLSKAQSLRKMPAILVTTWALLLVVGIGLAINVSLAGLGLGLTVTVASVFLLRSSGHRQLAIGASLTGLLLLAAITTIFLGPIQSKLTGPQALGQDLEQLTRRVSISKTLRASTYYLPTGSGVGTFRQIYQQAEDPSETTRTFMNHAHSDVSEIVLETGVAGMVLMLLLFAWWTQRAIEIWRAPYPDYFARAATMASGAIIAHSCVDYPLRTAAISTICVACFALMSQTRSVVTPSPQDKTNRHLEIT